jgi:uroporphyrin-III C-methyltransferase / precorrin-2 dehydrogenase / sirohydrochlorin ferrochelatase
MEYFPIFLRLKGERAVVVGGGEVASRKIDLLLRAGARVLVVAPELIDELQQLASEGRIEYIAGEFHPEHLNGARIAISATDKQSVNAWVAHQAESRQIPVNVVDDRELSRFIVPAIVDRSPVVVAIGSSGDAPVLTRRLREKLETFLPERLGALANFAGALRAKIKARIEQPDRRRRFWENFFDGSLASDILAGRIEAEGDEAQSRVENAITQATTTASSALGEVALVGAGPGDPGLMTLRGLRALQNADVVLYDRLVSDEILDLARRDAHRIYVGKAAGKAHVPQEGINDLLVQLAKEGKRVCRLKGGDPFIFGRGGEELEALAAEGIRFEVVPGITAAAGCAAYAGIPLTHRDHAQALTLVTGHCKGETDKVDWALLSRPGQTVVFYMGLGHLENIVANLCAHGVPETRSAAVIEEGTRATQRVVVAELHELAEKVKAQQIQSPALLIVGEVTRLHETLQWFNSTPEYRGSAHALASGASAWVFAESTEGRLRA